MLDGQRPTLDVAADENDADSVNLVTLGIRKSVYSIKLPFLMQLNVREPLQAL